MRSKRRFERQGYQAISAAHFNNLSDIVKGTLSENIWHTPFNTNLESPANTSDHDSPSYILNTSLAVSPDYHRLTY